MRARWGYKIVPTVIVSTAIACLFSGRYTDTTARFQLETSSIQIANVEGTSFSPQLNSQPSATAKKTDGEIKPTIALSGLEVDETFDRHNAELSELISHSREARSDSAETRDDWQLSRRAAEGGDLSHRLKSPTNRPSEIERSGKQAAQKPILPVATAPASQFSQHAKSPAITRPPTTSSAEVQAEMTKSRQVFAERALERNSRQSAQDPHDAEQVASLPAVPLASVGKYLELPSDSDLGTSPRALTQDQFVPFQQRADGDEFRVAPGAQPDLAAETTDQQDADKAGSHKSAPATSEQANMTSHLELDPKAFWWKQDLGLPLVDPDETESVSLDELIMIALQNSPRILAISQEPLVEELEVVKSESRFDPELFLRTKYDDRTDPVGNVFTTGGPSFLRDHIWTGDSGVRKKLLTGGGVELKQQLGFENSNSRFFVPQDQGTATLSLNFSQPLLKGAGRMYNNSRIMLAQTSSSAAWQKYYSDLQDELLRVAEAYWRLYYFRSVLVQKQRSLQRGTEILAKLEARSGLDSLPSQVARARAAAESRRSELANAVRDVKNAETEIRKLIAQKNWASSYNIEIIPSEPPKYDHVEFPVVQVVETALESRPEIKHSLDRAKAAAIEFDVSKNELLPELSMLFGTYVAGLEGNSDIGRAWTEQFTNTTPGYYAGLEYKIPHRNRAAKMEFDQRRLRLSKIRHEVDTVLQDVIADSQIALRRVNSAHRTLQSSVSAIEAANADLRYNQSRWEAFALVEGDFAERQNATTLLDQLLEAQQRLTNEEIRFAQAELEFKNSQFYLKRAMGTLLQTDPLNSN